MTFTIQALADRAEIQDVLHRYAQAQDQNAWALYDTVFTADAVVELVGTEMGAMPAAQLGSFLRDVFNATRVSGQHLIANTLIDLDGDTARSVSEVLYFTLQTTAKKGVLDHARGTSLYADTWLRTGDGWRISHRVTTQKHLESSPVDYDPAFLATITAGAATDWFTTDLQDTP